MWFNLPILGEVGLLTGQQINPSLTMLFIMSSMFVMYISYEIYKEFFYQPVFLLKEEYIVNTKQKDYSEYIKNPDGSIDAEFEEIK
jgi:hypothetical protein